MSKTTTKKRPTTLETLKDARTHIENKWVAGAWFTTENGDSSEVDIEHKQDVIGMCLAGSVLYSLDYLDEQWTDKEEVRPVIEALFDVLPPGSTAIADYKKAESSWNQRGDKQQTYENKVNAIVSWNDTRGRKKEQVLEVFDRAIEKVTAEQPLNIIELP